MQSFDAIFRSYIETPSEFSAEEVSSSFAKQGVAVEEAVEKHFTVSAEQSAADEDWSMV